MTHKTINSQWETFYSQGKTKKFKNKVPLLASACVFLAHKEKEPKVHIPLISYFVSYAKSCGQWGKSYFEATFRVLSTLWQYGLWSSQTGGTKLERFLSKNQHIQRKLLNFENWISGGLRSFQKSEF